MIETVSTSPEGKWVVGNAIDFAKPTAGKSNVILVDPATTFQSILGFGAAMTDASCWLFDRLTTANRARLFGELFSPEGLNLTVHRLCVGSSDYAKTAYHFAPTPNDMALRDFSIDHDRQYILPQLAEVKALNRDTFFFSSPWSPPEWMKSPNTFFGGWMCEKYLDVYARYYLRFLRQYADAGVPLQALTPQNEVETDQNSRMPACYWHPEFEAVFVRDHLGPAIAHERLGTKIWLLDHNYDLWRRVLWQLKDPALKQYTDGIAWHAYGGTADMMTRVHDAHPELNMHWTEGGPNMGKNYETNWCHFSTQIAAALRNWCQSYVGWNFALDENGKPNIGPFQCLGLVTINSKSRKIAYSGQYWALAHYSRYFTRGSIVISSVGEIQDIHHIAGVDPQGRRLLTITNGGKARTVKVREGKAEVKLNIPADGLVSLRW